MDSQLVRHAVTAVARRAPGLELPGLRLGKVAVTEDGGGVAAELAALLRVHGIEAQRVDEVPQDAASVIFLGGLRPVESADDAASVNHEAFRVAKTVADRLSTSAGAFVTVQDTGGDFGLGGGQGDRAWLGGLAALARTAGREWPSATVKAVDCATGTFANPRRIAESIVTELLTGGSVPEVGLRADGTRLVLCDEERAVTIAQIGPAVTNRSVVVASGGGRGVTGAALRALAAAHRPRIALLGRTALIDEPAGLQGARDELALRRALAQRAAEAGLPVPPPARLAAEAKQIVAVREIRDALAALEAAGSQVRYITADVRDARAVAAALDEVRAAWGPITGVVHGAGVIADRTIADKTPEQFADVFDTKVAGLRALLGATESDPLSFVGLFSSVSARYGNVGQSDYAMANEVLDQVACTVRRNRPNCVVRSIAWGPWQGGMVGTALEEHFRRSGVALIPLDGGARAFVAEVTAPDDHVRVVVTAGMEAAAETEAHAWTSAPELTGELRTGLTLQPFLSDHVISGKPVVPVALVLDWFWAAAAAHHAPETRTALRDVQVLSKIALEPAHFGPSTLQLVSRRHDAEEGGVHIKLLGGESLHYQAKAAHHAETAPTAWNGAELFNGSASAAAERAAARDLIYDGDVLFHGPRFHVLSKLAKLSAEGAEATVRGARHLGWGREQWRTDPAAIDGAFQLALLWAEHVMGAATLPMSVELFRWHAQGTLNEAARCVVRAGTVNEYEATCDAQLVSRDGAVVGELHGIRLLRRP